MSLSAGHSQADTGRQSDVPEIEWSWYKWLMPLLMVNASVVVLNTRFWIYLNIFVNLDHQSWSSFWSPWNPWCQRWWWQRRLKLHSWWKPLCTRLWMKILIWSTMHYDLIHYARRTHLWMRIFWCFSDLASILRKCPSKRSLRKHGGACPHQIRWPHSGPMCTSGRGPRRLKF